MSTSEQKPDVGCLKVSSKSSPASVAGAIAGMVKDGVSVEIQAVGAGAVNQAVKAIASSRGFLSASTALPYASRWIRAIRAASRSL